MKETATKIGTQNTPKASAAGAIPFFQPKLTVNTPGDAYEQEADAMADRVMRIPEGNAPFFAPVQNIRSIQRKCATCEEDEKVQRKEIRDPSGQSAPPEVAQTLSSNTGQPLDAGTQQFMGSRFGHDFSQVRVKTDAQASSSAQAIQAKAYTSGTDIVFGSGEYQPDTTEGRRLLAHELTHVVQQGGIGAMIQRVARPQCRRDRLSKSQYLRGVQWLLETGRISADRAATMSASIPSSRRERCRLINSLAGSGSSTRASAATRRGGSTPPAEHYVDYERLFADGSLDMVVGVGFDEHGSNPGWMTQLHTWTSARRFRRIVRGASPGIERYISRRSITYPLRAGGTRTQRITINLSVITPGVGAAASFLNALNHAEMSSYAGHARGGVGPDFDDIGSAAENIVLGDRTRRHRSGRFRRPNSHRRDVTYGSTNDFERMTTRGEWDTEQYRVWFFNACTTLNYMDEIRRGILPAAITRANLDVIGTRHLNPLMTTMQTTLLFLDGILNISTMEDLTAQMNEHTYQTMLPHHDAWERNPGASMSQLRDMYFMDGFEDNPVEASTSSSSGSRTVTSP